MGAVAGVGGSALPAVPAVVDSPSSAHVEQVTLRPRVGAGPPVAGLVGAAGLLAFYLGLITLAQGWGHAVDQLVADRWFVGAIILGFGAQVGLFTHLRALHAQRLRAAAGGTAVSTGTSAAAMLACCAHHLADVFAVLGIAGASTFLTQFKLPLLWLGIGMNVAGATYLVVLIRRARRSGASCH